MRTRKIFVSSLSPSSHQPHVLVVLFCRVWSPKSLFQTFHFSPTFILWFHFCPNSQDDYLNEHRSSIHLSYHCIIFPPPRHLLLQRHLDCKLCQPTLSLANRFISFITFLLSCNHCRYFNLNYPTYLPTPYLQPNS